jgi:hypothetical protein
VTSISQLRVPILAALATVEIAGVAYFYRRAVLDPHHSGSALTGFLKFSLMSIALIVPYLWQDWLKSRGIRYFEVFAFVVFGISSIIQYSHVQLWRTILSASLATLILVALLPRLLRPVGAERRQSNLRTAEKKGKSEHIR